MQLMQLMFMVYKVNGYIFVKHTQILLISQNIWRLKSSNIFLQMSQVNQLSTNVNSLMLGIQCLWIYLSKSTPRNLLQKKWTKEKKGIWAKSMRNKTRLLCAIVFTTLDGMGQSAKGVYFFHFILMLMLRVYMYLP